LWSVALAQACQYFQSSNYRAWWAKYLVGTVMLLDTAQIMIFATWIYGALIMFRGNLYVTYTSNWPGHTLAFFPSGEFVAGFIAFAVQGFFAWTVHILIRRMLLTVFVITSTIICFGASVGCAYVSRNPELAGLQRYKPLIVLWLVANVVVDNTVSFSLFLYLRKRRLLQSHTVLRFTTAFLATGMLTSLGNIAAIITFFTNGPELAFDLPLSGMYTNALLSILNCNSYRDASSDHTDILLSDGPQLTSVMCSMPPMPETLHDQTEDNPSI